MHAKLVHPSYPSIEYIDGLVQGCCNSIADTLELLQSCTKPSICLQILPWCTMVYLGHVAFLSYWLMQGALCVVTSWPDWFMMTPHFLSRVRSSNNGTHCTLRTILYVFSQNTCRAVQNAKPPWLIPPGQNAIFVNEMFCTLIKMSLKFVP